MKKVLKILLFGLQGSGKGTQAEMISQKYNLPILATGDIFRKEIEKKTELGVLAASLINKGNLVSDEITDKIVLGELDGDKYKNGFILDGYPRNLNQMASLEKKFSPTHVFELAISNEEAVKRLGGRRSCSKCGAIYHLENKPPKNNGICDRCGEHLITRNDDKPEAIRKRLQIYHEKTEPILSYYEKRSNLFRINGMQSAKKVFDDIVAEIEK